MNKNKNTAVLIILTILILFIALAWISVVKNPAGSVATQFASIINAITDLFKISPTPIYQPPAPSIVTPTPERSRDITLSCNFSFLNDDYTSQDRLSSCDFQYSRQGQYAENDYSVVGIQNEIITIHGSGVLAGRDTSIDEFLAYTEDEIRNRFETYLRVRPWLSRETQDIMLIDIEGAYGARYIGNYEFDTTYSQADIIDAYKRRIRIVREKLPNAKLALYDTISPDPLGRESDPQFIISMRGYRHAAELGMFDELDYLSPLLYQRFGPDDSSQRYNSIEAYTRLGVEASRTIKKTNGASIPLMPLLNPNVVNGNSANHHDLVLEKDIRNQVRVIEEYPEVDVVAIWSMRDELEVLNWFRASKIVPRICACPANNL